MNWKLFADTHIGGTHQAMGLPCQDSVLMHEQDAWRMVSVADGHGNRRHFRSDVGSRCACEAAKICLTLFMQGRAAMPAEDEVRSLKSEILRTWKELVNSHCLANPWTEEELEEQRLRMTRYDFDSLRTLRTREDVLYPYGSTLLAAVVTPDWWLALQLGDGITVAVDREGYFTWPMPLSLVNMGHLTASLCMRSPLPEFRHVLSDEPLDALLICTDGVEKAFPEQGEEVAEYLNTLMLLCREAHPGTERDIHEYLRCVAQGSALQDDTSAAGIVRTEA